MKRKPKILCICGSIRQDSSSFALAKAIPGLISKSIDYILFDGLGHLPHFDGQDPAPEVVDRFRSLIRTADGVVICSPEYAFGIPGSLKNALDWTVSSGDFDQKPIAIITASSQGQKGHAALLLVMTALSAHLPDGASTLISFIRTKLNDRKELTDPAAIEAVIKSVTALMDHIERESQQLAEK